jgi:hypothetical protein
MPSKREDEEEEGAQDEVGASPFEPRQFPLQDEEYDQMLTQMPDMCAAVVPANITSNP